MFLDTPSSRAIPLIDPPRRASTLISTIVSRLRIASPKGTPAYPLQQGQFYSGVKKSIRAGDADYFMLWSRYTIDLGDDQDCPEVSRVSGLDRNPEQPGDRRLPDTNPIAGHANAT